MPTYRTRALALKRTKLGEADLIVTLLAENGCQIRAVAKGARKTSSRFGARLEPFSVCDVLLATGRTLDVVTDVQTVTSHVALREDYDKMAAASVVADFLDKVSVECQPEERLFGLACATLDAMSAAEGEGLVALVAAFLAKGMALHGYRPEFDACVVCGNPVGRRMRFALAGGGVVCDACGQAAADTVALDGAVRGALATLMRARMAEVCGLRIPASVAGGCLTLMRAFVGYHLPSRLKALDYYCAETSRESTRR